MTKQFLPRITRIRADLKLEILQVCRRSQAERKIESSYS
jgi:hypothetical protein